MPGQGGSSTWVEQENFNQIESAINQLQISVNDLTYDVGRILSALNKGTTPTALTIDVVNQQILAKDGTLIMSGIATVTSNYNLRIPLIWQDFSRHGYRAAQFEDAFARFLPHEPNIRTLKSGCERM